MPVITVHVDPAVDWEKNSVLKVLKHQLPRIVADAVNAIDGTTLDHAHDVTLHVLGRLEQFCFNVPDIIISINPGLKGYAFRFEQGRAARIVKLVQQELYLLVYGNGQTGISLDLECEPTISAGKSWHCDGSLSGSWGTSD